MKNLILLLSFAYCLSSSLTMHAQDTTINSDTIENYQKRSPIYDYGELQLSNTTTIPDYESKTEKLKISGTIYESDGVTPAKDVILYIEQPDEHGDFDLRRANDKRYVHHRGWIKTDADGKYTFYTFIPGNDRRFNQLQQLYPIVKAPSGPSYELASFLFDADPLLTKACRKKINKKDDPSRILTPTLKDGLFVVQKDIVLNTTSMSTK
ncbi:MAG: hypothetical protein KJO77_03740 [Bacteroidia bacterium]|nr:hypothetical protein [Bacteroidia bacterium]